MNTQQSETVRVRYAPSPTGLLHVGNLRTALFAWLFARQSGGQFVLRIEDTDLARSDSRYEDCIYRDLRWCALDWDEGPDVGGTFGPYRQSERFSLYHQQAEKLEHSGRAFRCFCSEDALNKQAEGARHLGKSWNYPGTCRNLSQDETDRRIEAGEASTVRLKVREGLIEFDDIVHGAMQFSSEVISDPILLRTDGSPTYNFAVVVDDSLMEISHVIRGDDHLPNTPKQVLIYEAFNHPAPAFAHLSTILGPDQARLSKRHGATSAADFREMGYLPEALVNYIALLGWSPGASGSELLSIDRLIGAFRLDRVNKNPAVFDVGKLKFMNRQYLKNSPKIAELVEAVLRDAEKLPDRGQKEWVDVVSDTLLGSIDVITELPKAVDALLVFPIDDAEVLSDVTDDDEMMKLIRLFAEELDSDSQLTVEHFKRIVTKLKQTTGRKGRDLFHPLRVALTARPSGPALDKLIPLVETAAEVGISGILGCRARVKAFIGRYG